MNIHGQHNPDGALVVTTSNHDDMSHLIDAYADHLSAYCTPNTTRFRRYLLRSLHHVLPPGIAWAATTDLEAWLARPTVSVRTRGSYRTIIRSFTPGPPQPAGSTATPP